MFNSSVFPEQRIFWVVREVTSFNQSTITGDTVFQKYLIEKSIKSQKHIQKCIINSLHFSMIKEKVHDK